MTTEETIAYALRDSDASRGGAAETDAERRGVIAQIGEMGVLPAERPPRRSISR
jgi:hypothetical protein